MIDTNKLRGAWVSKGMNQSDVAKVLGVSDKTLSLKLKKGVFDSDEIESLIIVLDITDPISVFFPQLVTFKDTRGGTHNATIHSNSPDTADSIH